MVRSDSRSPTMSLGRSVARVRVTSPSLKRKPASSCIRNDQEVKFLGDKPEDTNFRINAAAAGAEYDGGNKVMVVADSSMEAKGALDWALSHTIQPQDTIVLLHVGKPRKRESSKRKRNPRVDDLLNSMKNMCQMKKPGVRVEVAKVEGKEKGAIIVEGAKQLKVSLLVLGQRKKSIIWRLMRRLTAKRGGVVDYCIQNASCMTIAVRRKSNQLGGYLITTKRHKKFWLLA
ncbi:universal stress protein PHOS32-like [Hibiscus syriacus]|uniref:universal stress protein PHOS32-like n=1 Tax=Hibiscus syriacus TaxID=106335 RepID=UPI001923373F|nr:universal stress protein PHOS32-like [Hibiscus syriacus]